MCNIYQPQVYYHELIFDYVPLIKQMAKTIYLWCFSLTFNH